MGRRFPAWHRNHGRLQRCQNVEGVALFFDTFDTFDTITPLPSCAARVGKEVKGCERCKDFGHLCAGATLKSPSSCHPYGSHRHWGRTRRVPSSESGKAWSCNVRLLKMVTLLAGESPLSALTYPPCGSHTGFSADSSN